MSLASLCFLSYERPDFLRRAIDSALLDPGGALEVIVHDDGSHDERVIVYLNEQVRHGQISTLILNPAGHNQGVGEAIRRCFAIAAGDLLIKADQDLEFRPGWLTRAREILDGAHDGTPVGVLGFFHYHADPVDTAKTRIAQHDGWQQHSHFCASAFAISRAVYEAYGIETHSDAFAEDWDLMRRITDGGAFCCALPDEDLVVNHGFGVGPSTVVVAPDTVKTIHHGPFIHP